LILSANQSTIITNPNIPINAKESLPLSNPAGMESVLLQEFNLHNNELNSNLNHTIPEINTINSNNINSAINSNNKVSNLNNYANLINPNELHKIKSSLNNSLNNHIQEGEFLQNILESDKQLLHSLQDDVEKINKQIISVTDKNKLLRDEIVEYRRKINMERDNLIRATNKLYSQTNEIINTKGILLNDFNFKNPIIDEHQKVKGEYNNNKHNNNVELEHNNQSAQNQAQSSSQSSNNPYMQNNAWANPMNYNHNMNYNNYPPINSNENINPVYNQNQTNIYNQNPNTDISVNSTRDINNAHVSKSHSRNVSINKDTMIPNHALDHDPSIGAQNNSNLKSLDNPAFNNAYSLPINTLSVNSIDDSNILAVNNFNNNVHIENPHSNLSFSSGHTNQNDNNYHAPVANSLLVSSVNLQPIKENINTQIVAETAVLPSVNQINVNENPNHMQGSYPTLDTDFKFDENNTSNNLKNEKPTTINQNTNLNPNHNSSNNYNAMSENKAIITENSTSLNTVTPHVNNQFNFNANDNLSRKESDFDFDFNGYDKVDTFKDIANKKGEDLFKKAHNNFDSDWDF